ncbi:Cell division protein FtsB [Arthrobacter sp. cf158]|uniref:FtsB family cell division protein n=1 Tax=Arthrobacter sp. cf158 TaxID=1761744 RepID=UPI00089CE07E|nr:septum formation initiator family protein [Arthrobacter sp. cf158]SDW07324.1 Cell division protein FtsB [Arthrobacter sp. cf158]
MATRRPKVPRADALGRPAHQATPPSGTRPPNGTPRPAPKAPDAANPHGGNPDGADVIKGEFGATRAAPKTSTSAAGRNSAAATHAVAGKAAAGKKPTTGRSSAGGSNKTAAKSPGTAGSAAKDDHHLDPVPAKAFSGRMLALAVVMIAITIMLAPTVKIFLEKRAEISALEGEIAGKKAEQTELNKQISRWQDPNYVKQQARDRINMVMPGETGYWVFGGEEAAGTPGGRTGSGSSANPENLPWVDALWESIRRSATD